jgi:hypothetical protein
MNPNGKSKFFWIIPVCIMLIGVLMLIGNLGVNLGRVGQFALPVLLIIIGAAKFLPNN